ncbi:MAG: hypothetical protein WC756_13175 [Taibaiella sp.]|jgi:hypothetical protein
MHKEIKLARAHCIKECRKWQTVLNELRTRNVQLKEQLSQAIKGDVSLSFVEQAEIFQQKFVEKDQILELLRHDVRAMLDKLLEHGITGTVERQYSLLKKDIAKLMDEFYQMEMSFSEFVASNKNK